MPPNVIKIIRFINLTYLVFILKQSFEKCHKSLLDGRWKWGQRFQAAAKK